jgi:hypothetical protein
MKACAWMTGNIEIGQKWGYFPLGDYSPGTQKAPPIAWPNEYIDGANRRAVLSLTANYTDGHGGESLIRFSHVKWDCGTRNRRRM